VVVPAKNIVSDLNATWLPTAVVVPSEFTLNARIPFLLVNGGEVVSQDVLAVIIA
jgi:hypothetical protein